MAFVFCNYTGQRYSIGETTKAAMNVLLVIPLFSVFIHYQFVVVFPLNCIYRIVYGPDGSFSHITIPLFLFLIRQVEIFTKFMVSVLVEYAQIYKSPPYSVRLGHFTYITASAHPQATDFVVYTALFLRLCLTPYSSVVKAHISIVDKLSLKCDEVNFG